MTFRTLYGHYMSLVIPFGLANASATFIDLINWETRPLREVLETLSKDILYDVALALNTFGAKNVLDFAAKCANIKLLLHVSTVSLLFFIYMYRANRMAKYLCFYQGIREMILGHLKGNMPLVILRPTIITSTYKEPFRGWIEGIRTIDSLAVGYGKGRLSCFLGDPESVIDVIPADMVVSAMIATMVAHANQASCGIIYHIGSSVSNPLKYKSIQQSGYNYFSKHPWINKDGKPVIVSEVKVLNSMATFQRYFSLRYLLPLQGLQVVNSALCHALNGTYSNLKRKTCFVLRLVELYKPYLFSKSFYDDMNTEKLRQLVREKYEGEIDMFYFDPKTIVWDIYFEHTHLPGTVKHVLK
ncbi:alcohol-forming fatty acyl-CoA reductase-like [Bidens hawaiensis]|uniref:alcohol-forming fatty acyl-CoA reductase-like n=1 Tax=Bidens hawaiensis TaxID=980011 RepID=UPI004049DF90